MVDETWTVVANMIEGTSEIFHKFCMVDFTRLYITCGMTQFLLVDNKFSNCLQIELNDKP
ncbi:CLUMA_CG021547, isoform A [Clunio marinus]|uniref:CLUMA_CG021547, isoform A n=1 Tax=Clunio marinus TaxID=568069 RepID=A0A1J1J9W0_9DIPT|nr:CLUMA_CG021547, isoform A [Clunio marinus]